MRIKTHVHVNGFALSLALKQRPVNVYYCLNNDFVESF